jgi:peptide/nickel transport system permease protein
MPELGYILRRLGYAILTIFIIANINFLIFQLIPQGLLNINPVYFFIPASAGSSWPPSLILQVESTLGLNQPWDVRYLKYIEAMFTAHFGYSFQAGHQPVSQILEEYAPRTILLISTVLIASAVAGSLLGAKAAINRGRLDKFLQLTSFSTFSLPDFWIGLMLLFLLSVKFHLFPISLSTAETTPNGSYTGINYVTHLLWAMTLPWVTLFIVTFGSYLVIVRNTMINVLAEDYIRMAKVRGIPNRLILSKYAMRNSILPVISTLGIQLAKTLTGAVIAETVFSFQGLGYTLFVSIENQDFPTVQAIFFIVAVLVVLGNLLVDITYSFIDPRIRFR